MRTLGNGKYVHAYVNKGLMKSDIFLWNNVIDTYNKYDRIKEACEIFDRMELRNVCTWTLMIAGYTKHGNCKDAQKLFWGMQSHGIMPDNITFLTVLGACVRVFAIEEGKRIHAYILLTEFQMDLYVSSNLLDMYAKCGHIEDAHNLFDSLLQRDIVSWNTMVGAYAQRGHTSLALDFLRKMQEEGMSPNAVSLSSILHACAVSLSLEHGKWLHCSLARNRQVLDMFLGNTLVDMYVKCVSIHEARQIFDQMTVRDVITWNEIIAGHVQFGNIDEAFKLLMHMQEEGIKPNQVTFMSFATACTGAETFQVGKWLHTNIIRAGSISNTCVESSLVRMYAKCGCLAEACQVFDAMFSQDTVSWNALIMGYAQYNDGIQYRSLFRQMKLVLKPDKFTLLGILTACTLGKAFEMGRLFHAEVLKYGIEFDVSVGTSLIDMYSKCGRITYARHVFDRMPEKDVVSWNSIIAGYCQDGKSKEALVLFQRMQLIDLKADKVTITTLLGACAAVSAIEHGKLIHARFLKKEGGDSDAYVTSTLIDMYAKCGNLRDAYEIFITSPIRNLVVYSAMLAGYAWHRDGKNALEVFKNMQKEGTKPNQFTFVSILAACTMLEANEHGKFVHAYISRHVWESTTSIANTLICMYGIRGKMKDAYRVFDRMTSRNTLSWNAIIGGCIQHADDSNSLKLFVQMQVEQVIPDKVTYVNVFMACARISAFGQGKRAHATILKIGSDMDPALGNTLIDMYSNCADMLNACHVFDWLNTRNVISWSAMIAGFAWHGNGDAALELFQQMGPENVKTDSLTFTSLLTACSHSSFLDDGCHNFCIMSLEYLLAPRMQHYACMVDLYSRAGYLDVAEDFIKTVPLESNFHIWKALLGGCRIYGDYLRADMVRVCLDGGCL